MKANRLRIRKSLLFLVISILFIPFPVRADNVTISPSSGKLIAGETYLGEAGFEKGWSSLWRHNQLPLTLTISDKSDLTSSGVLKDPAGNIVLDVNQNKYVIFGGEAPTSHLCISLPRGYRFTGYRLVLLNNMNGKTISDLTAGSQGKRLYETDQSFNTGHILARTADMPAQNDTKEYVIERTSRTKDDMGNNLYFLLGHDSNSSYCGATIKSCELYFTSENVFDVPMFPAGYISSGVNMVGVPFATGKLDLGTIKQRYRNGRHFYSYNFNNVKDLTANCWLYQESAVTSDKKLPGSAGSGTIQASNGKFLLGNNTYYIEAPTETKDQNNKTIPLGYRVVGAKIHYGYSGYSGSYTLKVYSTNKNEVYKTVTVKAGDEGTVELTSLNNDAVKFQIEGMPSGRQAQITVDLTLDMLDPYVNSIDLICTSKQAGNHVLVQQVNSSDFKISGGPYKFYVPKDFIGQGYNSCKLSFGNLTSKYMDDTYGIATNGRARDYFVKSPYYNHFGDGQQYNATGTEAASDKVFTEQCGNKPFRFSNIDDLNNTSDSWVETQLEEYPFSVENYANHQTPAGSFDSNVEIENGTTRNCYLFVGDETHWNIAPTTAMEHRVYAYYDLNITLQVADYDARCELNTIYDYTCYDGDADKPMYSATFKALAHDTHEEIPTGQAFLTANMMQQALTTALAEKHADGKQVLNLDYTRLYAVEALSEENMNAFKATLNPNCLQFFPEGINMNYDNCIQKTPSGDYRAYRNVVLTDKQPFYTPHKITVPAENYATYTRLITVDKNGKVANATAILPYALDLDGQGVHTNRAGDCSFSVNTMKSSYAIAFDANGVNNNPVGCFSPVTGGSTVPNTPYMIHVTGIPAGDQVSFIATQYGTTIESTESMNPSKYTFDGETATGGGYTFNNRGSYSGRKIVKGDKVYYFANNKFVASGKLVDGKDYVYVYPFRAFYASNAASFAKQLPFFDVTFDDMSTTTGIDELTTRPDLMIKTGTGSLTFVAQADDDVTVYNVSGMRALQLKVRAGETRTVNMPAGMYIINGAKVIVK